MENKINFDKGSVWIVGAGPGDPGLLTVLAVKAIRTADVIFYDALINSEVLHLAKPIAKLVYVGKKAKKHSISQLEISSKLVSESKKNKRVLRLKGGDPFIFGRGGEEMEYLQQRGVEVDIVPGITAAGGCAAAAGIPLTHRDYGNALVLHSGHSKFNEFSPCQNPTRVFYMGLRQAGPITAQLLQEGLHESTPVALITNGTLANQQVFKGVLMDLAYLAERYLKSESDGPGLIIVGEVAAMARSNKELQAELNAQAVA